MLDVSRSDLVAGVAGAGTMGRGIAQVLAQGGARTLLFDAQPDAAQKARASIAQALGKLVEPWTTDALTALAQRFGHAAVRCKDTPGFIVNHAGRAFVPEALRVLSEGVADFAAIDRILVDAAGFRIGPFGLMDLVGLDVNHAVMKSMYQQYFEEPKYRPSFLVEPRVAAGLLGRKTGRGWYEYAKDGTAGPISEPSTPSVKPG